MLFVRVKSEVKDIEIWFIIVNGGFRDWGGLWIIWVKFLFKCCGMVKKGRIKYFRVKNIFKKSSEILV